MADYLRPAVAMTPWSPGNGGYYGPQSYQAWGNPGFFSDARTPWARFWIRWDYLQPWPGSDPATETREIPGFPGLTPQQYLQQQVWQVQAARNDGRKVILTLYAYPSWTNAETRASGPANPNPGDRPDYNSPPWDVSTSSPFATIVWYLASYFHTQSPANPGASIDFLEVANEPNLQFWPQLNAQGQPQMHLWAAAMLGTARHVTRVATGNLPVILGPGMSDTARTDTASSGLVHWKDFTTRTLDTMAAWGIGSDAYLGWTIHNYGDIRYDENRAREARMLLESKGWAGWPYGDRNRVYVLATEGGWEYPDFNTEEENVPLYNTQRDRITSNWERMRNTAGVGMVTNYLLWSNNLGFDTGLCKQFPDPPPSGTDRSVYHRPVLPAWAGLPTSAPR